MIDRPLLLVVAPLLVAGCFDFGGEHIDWPVSLHGIRLDRDTFVDYDLAGAWREGDDPDDPPSVMFGRIQDTYTVNFRYADESDLLAGQSVQLGSVTLVDLSLAPGKWGPLLFNKAAFVVPVHLLLRVDHAEDSLRLRLLDTVALQRLGRRHPGSLPYTKVNGGILITATTAQLRAFLMRYGQDESLFEPNDWMVRFGGTESSP
jgi:hypothetical protein